VPEDRPVRPPYQGSYPASPFGPAQPGAGASGAEPGWYPPGQYPGQHPPYGPQYPPGPPPGGRRTGLLVTAVVVALVLASGVVAGLFLLRRDNAQPAASTGTAAPATSATPRSATLTSAPTPARPAPTVGGWQVAISGKRSLAYDVPPDWKVLDEDAIIGFEDASGPKVGMSGASTYKEGYCAAEPHAWRAGAGFSGYQDTDLGVVATDAAGKWGRFGYLGQDNAQPRVDVAAPERIEVNGISGVYATSTVKVTAPTACSPPTAKVHAVALPATGGGSYVFVLFADQQVPDAVPDDLARKIINTIRRF
jgi:hypothetical protein